MAGREEASEGVSDEQARIPGEAPERPDSAVSVAEQEGDFHADSDGKKAGMRLQCKWEDMLNRLITYRDKHGDCLVPNRYPDDPQLGSWGTYFQYYS